MKYHVSYYYEDGSYDLLLNRSYNSDIEAFRGELYRTIENNENPKKRNISHFKLYRYVPQVYDWKHLITQHFISNFITFKFKFSQC